MGGSGQRLGAMLDCQGCCPAIGVMVEWVEMEVEA